MPDDLKEIVRQYRRQLDKINADIDAVQAKLDDLRAQKQALIAARDDITGYLATKGITP
jgi:Skp family chaperone for outer membrane proteins